MRWARRSAAGRRWCPGKANTCQISGRHGDHHRLRFSRFSLRFCNAPEHAARPLARPPAPWRRFARSTALTTKPFVTFFRFVRFVVQTLSLRHVQAVREHYIFASFRASFAVQTVARAPMLAPMGTVPALFGARMARTMPAPRQRAKRRGIVLIQPIKRLTDGKLSACQTRHLIWC
jgi:hypothetical protein